MVKFRRNFLMMRKKNLLKNIYKPAKFHSKHLLNISMFINTRVDAWRHSKKWTSQHVLCAKNTLLYIFFLKWRQIKELCLTHSNWRDKLFFHIFNNLVASKNIKNDLCNIAIVDKSFNKILCINKKKYRFKNFIVQVFMLWED